MLPRASRSQGLAPLKQATGQKQDIEIGGLYLAKVGARSVEVRIEGTIPKGGWNARSMGSGKPIRIKDAARLRPVKAATPEPQRTQEAVPEKGVTTPETELVPLTQIDREKKKPPSKAAKAVKEKAMSCLDAAAQVLKDKGEPLQCKAMIEAMFAARLWHSDAPTPAATLYSAILREIGKKGTASRFRKTDRGHFALNA